MTTGDSVLMERAVRAHDQGSLREGQPQVPDFCGENYRMSELTGAVVSVQLARVDEITGPTRRAQERLLEGLSAFRGLTPRARPDAAGDVGVGVVLALPSEASCQGFVRALVADGIAFRRVYGGKPVYQVDRIKYKRTWDGRGTPFRFHPDSLSPYREGLCPRTEDLVARSAAISLSPTWTAHDVEDVLEAIGKVMAVLALTDWNELPPDPVRRLHEHTHHDGPGRSRRRPEFG